ncbi:MAG: hypothetical protein WAN43_15645 [Rhodomicrobium sp.]|jgi:hypothetical protein
MRDRLIITNGDDAVARMREARIGGEILPWRDILHEGPVPASLSLEELSAVRASFLARRGWMSEEELRAAFGARDAIIRRHGEFKTVVLWFEHDLYDQLQLLQILDFLAGEKRTEGVFVIQAGKYLALEKPRALKTHFHLMEPAGPAHFALARLAWTSFRARSPEPWVGLLRLSTHVLPFLRLALLRLLDELPHPRSGLSRTERTILSLIGLGVKRPTALYTAFTASEEAFNLGDLSFYHTIEELGAGGAPLIAGFKGLSFSPSMPDEAREDYLARELSFTHLGYSVLAGHADALQHRQANRDIGGLHFNSRSAWRWNSETRQLTPPPA